MKIEPVSFISQNFPPAAKDSNRELGDHIDAESKASILKLLKLKPHERRFNDLVSHKLMSEEYLKEVTSFHGVARLTFEECFIFLTDNNILAACAVGLMRFPDIMVSFDQLLHLCAAHPVLLPESTKKMKEFVDILLAWDERLLWNTNSSEQTAMHIAAAAGNTDFMRLLESRGARLGIDKTKRSPDDYAKAKCRVEIRRLETNYEEIRFEVVAMDGAFSKVANMFLSKSPRRVTASTPEIRRHPLSERMPRGNSSEGVVNLLEQSEKEPGSEENTMLTTK